MPTLNRYIARMYLTNILVLSLVLFGFIVTVDVFVNLGRFYRAAASTADAARSDPGTLHNVLLTLVGVLRLWAPRLLQLFAYLNGAILVAAAGFTCAQLVRHRELVAVLAGGVSLHRVARPFVAVAIGMTGLQALDQELLVPAVAPLLARDAGDAFKDDVDPFRVRMTPDAEGRLFHAERFDTDEGRLVAPTIWERDDSGKVRRLIAAESASWDGRGWVLAKGQAWNLGAQRETIERLDSSLDPTTIKVRTLSSFGEALSIRQLTQVAQSGALPQPARERLDRLRWGRAAGWLGNVVTLLAVLPLFLLRTPGSMVAASLKAAPLMAGGLVASAAGAGLALPGLPVWLGAFVPCLLLVPVAIALFTGMRT